MKRALMIYCLLWIVIGAMAQTANGIDLTRANLVYHEDDTPLARQMVQVLADDIERVSECQPLSGRRREHTVTLSIIDPGQIIQKITFQ